MDEGQQVVVRATIEFELPLMEWEPTKVLEILEQLPGRARVAKAVTYNPGMSRRGVSGRTRNNGRASKEEVSPGPFFQDANGDWITEREDGLVTKREAAQYLGVSKSALDHAKRVGRLVPEKREGSALLYRPDDVAFYAENRRESRRKKESPA